MDFFAYYGVLRLANARDVNSEITSAIKTALFRSGLNRLASMDQKPWKQTSGSF